MYKYLLRITFETLKNDTILKKKINFIKINNKFQNININGFLKIKQKKKIITLLRSPHIYKKSREHFIYKKFIIKIDINLINLLNLLNYIIIINKILNKKIKIKIIKNVYNLKG